MKYEDATQNLYIVALDSHEGKLQIFTPWLSTLWQGGKEVRNLNRQQLTLPEPDSSTLIVMVNNLMDKFTTGRHLQWFLC